MTKTSLVLIAMTLALASVARAAPSTTWQGDVFKTDWNTPGDWSNGVPAGTTDVILTDVPSGILDINGLDADALSISVQPFASPLSIMSSTNALNLFGDFINASSSEVAVSAAVNFKAALTLNGQGAPLSFFGFSSPAINTVTIQGLVNLGNEILLGLDSSTVYGRFIVDSLATLDLSGLTTIAFSASTYRGTANDRFQLFDLTNGSWSGASALSIDQGTLPELASGLTWSLASFEIDGSISVVSEPAAITILPTWVLLAFFSRRGSRRFKLLRPGRRG